MEFCPKCFIIDGDLSVLTEADKYECPECSSTFPLNAVMVSEDVVRTHIKSAPMSTIGIMNKLQELTKD